MAVPTQAGLQNISLDRIQANSSDLGGFTTADILRHHNNAYQLIWEMAGGRIRKVPSATAWTSAQLTTGTLQGILTDINDIRHVFGTTTAPIAVASVDITGSPAVTLTKTGQFTNVVGGMHIASSAGLTGDAYVAAKTSDDVVTSSRAISSTPVTITFSPITGTIELKRVEYAEIQWNRMNSGQGTYAAPKLYSVSYQASPIAIGINLAQLDYWPGTTGYYFPIHYVPQFTEMTASTDVPDVTDIEARDIAYWAAAQMAPLIGRAELVPSIMADISENTRLALERKMGSLISGKQDR